MKVWCELQDYSSLDRSKCKSEIVMTSDCIDSDHVIIKIGDEERVINGIELMAAINNCMNK